MSDCCTTNSPKIIIRPNSCGQATVTAPKVNADTGIGCVPSTPRDLVGQGFLVSFYYYQGSESQTEFSGPDKNGNTLSATANSMVFVNGVMLDDDTYILTASVLTLSDPCQTDEDIVAVVVFRQPESSSDSGDGGTGQVSTLNVLTIPPDDDVPRPMNQPASLELVTTQFDANWFLNDRIEEVEKKVDGIEIPEGQNLALYALKTEVEAGDSDTLATAQNNDLHILASANSYCDDEIKKLKPLPSVEGLASQEWVLDQGYITEQVVTDAVDAQAQTQKAFDDSQDTKISTLENKVDALEGTVVEAKFKADPRDDPQTGSFVLKNMLNEKVFQFNQASYIILSETDFTNKPIDASKVMTGDIVRLVMSPRNYANFTVTGVASRNGNINLEVTFGSAGPEGVVLDGTVYDFTHTTPFDIGAACTKQYSDDQDAVTLKAAKDYADSLDIPEAVVTDGFLSDTGEQHIKPEWKIRDPNKAYTYITIAPSGGMGLYHLKTPDASHHAVPVSYLEEVCFNSVIKTINLRSEESDHVKISCSDPNDWAPQNNEKNILRGNYKSNGGSLSEWSFGFNQHNQYWQYDWDMGSSNCCMTWHIKGDKKFTIDTSGAKMANAYIVRDTDFSGVAEEDYEAVSQAAIEIDIGHRLRELKNILVNLKTALATKSADAQQALLDVLENVEEI